MVADGGTADRSNCTRAALPVRITRFVAEPKFVEGDAELM
jgi:hypothetical protein